MKYVIIIPDGAADTPIPDLGNKTPLEVAKKPHIDSVAFAGKLGTVKTTPPGYSAGSDVCTLCLLGYEPAKYHPGRAPLEAAAMGLQLDPQDWVFRCNLVTIVDQSGIPTMMDHSAGHIGDQEARILLEAVRKVLAPDGSSSPLTFFPGVSYRNLMTVRGLDFSGLKTTPPHDIPEQPIKSYMPKGGKHAEIISDLILRSHQILQSHEINLTRRDLGENQASHIWLWGQGKAPSVPTFQSRFQKSGAMITAVDLLRGIANLLGWQNLDCPGITSYHDTDYAMQGQVTIDNIEKYDIVCCHVEAPDEASHAANYSEKIESIEAIDTHVVGPVLEFLKKNEARLGGYRILIMPDHATQCTTRKHYDEPVPFAIAGTGMPARQSLKLPYTESAAKQGDLHIQQGFDLMEYFLHANLK